ncbi:MAG: hypothetical protein ACRDTR_02545 [Rubrobacter sp.]
MAIIEGMARPTATRRISAWRTPLLALGLVLLAFASGPADAATTFTVNSTDDTGDISISDGTCDSDPVDGEQCTLRAAIEEANHTAGADTIEFDIVDGTNPAKTISPASQLPTITDTITIDGYTQSGATPNTLVEGNDALLNVQLDGLNAGSGADGLVIEAADSTIRGLVIRRFEDTGVQISGGATGNRIEGNYIGTNAEGTDDLGNAELGIDVINADDNTIGGTTAGARNVISGNDQSGVLINGPEATDNRIEGNYIGTNAEGTADLGNTQDGVAVESARNTVGGTTAGARNVISGNDQSGVFIGFEATENRVEGNYIGTTADRTGDLGNTAAGVTIQESANFTAVGGIASGATNRIAHNGTDGVSISGSNSGGNNILSNSIFDNGELGIDIVGGAEDASGVTANDPQDPDTGPNTLQNYPRIVTATRSNTTGLTTISGRLNSNPTQDFVIQCFHTNGEPASAHGEGLRLLATTFVSTNATGDAGFSCVSSRPSLGQVPEQTVSATATNVLTTGDTSEFSKNKAITTVP